MRFCAHCGARLGLSRHTDAGKDFCAKECLADYQDSLDRVSDVTMRQWRDYLYGQRP